MFAFNGKSLTISRKDLTSKEQKHLESLMRLGDSENIALWTIEHMDRTKPDNTEDYRRAYES